MNYQEVLSFLFEQLPMYQRQGKTAFKKDLENIKKLCSLLGSPEKKFKSIHIAGTNGKGSVAHLLASIFQSAGFKTGLYTSPHLVDFRERVKIDGKLISETEVISFVQENLKVFENLRPSFFEWTVALAFNYFANEKVDIAIIETGLGGRLDSTNVISPELSVITNIGLDHTEFLGETKAEIASEKAGIIKENIPVVIGNSSGQRTLFDQISQSRRAPLSFAEDLKFNFTLNSALKGNYQKENLKTVYAAWLQLRKQNWNISFTQFQNGLDTVLDKTKLQGRWQEISQSPKVIADTAHNKEGLSYTISQLKKENKGQLHIVFGLVKEKKLDNILNLLPKNAHYYFCAATIPRAMNQEDLMKAATKFGLKGMAYTTVREALKAAKKSAKAQDTIYIGGSTFVVAEIL
jgi:dihydrofolate synthase/folylpolyglutamate synthase